MNLSNTQGTLGGKLRLDEKAAANGSRPLSGNVSCVNGKSWTSTAPRRPGDKGTIAGTLGAGRSQQTSSATRPTPAPPSRARPARSPGIYKLSPRSACFGGKFELEGSGSSYSLKARDEELGTLAYDSRKGAVTGDVECTQGR